MASVSSNRKISTRGSPFLFRRLVMIACIWLFVCTIQLTNEALAKPSKEERGSKKTKANAKKAEVVETTIGPQTKKQKNQEEKERRLSQRDEKLQPEKTQQYGKNESAKQQNRKSEEYQIKPTEQRSEVKPTSNDSGYRSEEQIGRNMTPEETSQYSEDFKEFDINFDGFLDAQELRTIFEQEKVDAREIYDFFYDVDLDSSGLVSFKEYIAYVMSF